MEENLREIELYVQENPESTNTQLFSFLVLLRAYVPYSYLLMSECLKILGPSDPIHGGPPFEERMIPFAALINVSGAEAECRCSIDRGTAQRVLELLANLRFANGYKKFTRSNIMKKLIRSHHVQYIKDLLTKRKRGKKDKKPFSRLITDIKNTENHYHAVSVLKTASDTFKEDPFFPQTISRHYCKEKNYEQAQKWTRTAIKRAPHNSYVADTLGQIYKRRLRKAGKEDVIRMADEAFRAFEEVEEKAEREVARDTEDAVSNSNSFNNRGLFGFIQVAKLAIKRYPCLQKQSLIQNKNTKVKDTFDFFEWYLTYSKPDKKTPEPDYFWKDVALCYQYYTENSAAESTSFAGLLDSLSHGLVTSKGRRAGFEEAEKTVSELETIQRTLKGNYEKQQPKSVDFAERYILSNIILCNKTPDSPHITPMAELKKIISEFLPTDVGRRSPEFYLLVLLLFWPEVDQNQNVTLDLEMYATYMEKAFERSKFAKYLRGRYLLPLFFLGKGSGLSKWIHRSRLDAIMKNQKHTDRDMLEIPEIQDMLLPVTVEPCHAATTPQEHENQEVVVCVGENKVKAEVNSPNCFYLGVTIQGRVLFTVRPSPTDTNLTN